MAETLPPPPLPPAANILVPAREPAALTPIVSALPAPVAAKPPRPLTAKLAEFVRQYPLCGFNATEAARRSGYSEKGAEVAGHRALRNAGVQAALNESLSKRAKKLDLDADWVIRNLRKVYRMASAAVPVVDREGKPTGEYKADYSAANKSLELIGKYLKLFTDRVDLTSGGKRIEAPKPAQIMIFAGQKIEFT